MQAFVAAVLCTNAARHGASSWNSPVWPLLPMLLNRLTELLALGFGHIYLTVRGMCRRLPSRAQSCPLGDIKRSALENGFLLKRRQLYTIQEAVASAELPCLPCS